MQRHAMYKIYNVHVFSPICNQTYSIIKGRSYHGVITEFQLSRLQALDAILLI